MDAGGIFGTNLKGVGNKMEAKEKEEPNVHTKVDQIVRDRINKVL